MPFPRHGHGFPKPTRPTASRLAARRRTSFRTRHPACPQTPRDLLRASGFPESPYPKRDGDSEKRNFCGTSHGDFGNNGYLVQKLDLAHAERREENGVGAVGE